MAEAATSVSNGNVGLDAFVEALGMLPNWSDGTAGTDDTSAASAPSSVVTIDAPAPADAAPTTRTVISNMPGVPPGLVVEDVWDGRCFALLHSRDPTTQLHYRCTYSVSAGSLFCLAYHKHERERACGTVWQHKSRCTACHRDKNARFRIQEPPHTDMQFAPDRPAGPKRARSSEDDTAAAAPPPAPPPLPTSRTRAHAAPPAPMYVSAAANDGEDDSATEEATPAMRPPAVATGVRVNQLLATPGVGSREWDHESRYVGPSGIRLRVRLACMLQPANWCAEAPRMLSCLADGGVDSSSGDTAALEDVLRTSVASELTSAPIAGDTWLTSSFIDLIALKVARAYPGVHFLPSSFMAFDLPNACKALDSLHAFVPQDLLGRPVKLQPDAIPPAVYDSDDVVLLDVEGLPQAGLPSVVDAEEAAFRAAHPPPAPPVPAPPPMAYAPNYAAHAGMPGWNMRAGTPGLAPLPPSVLSASLGIGNSPMMPLGTEATATFSPFMLGVAPYAAPQEPLDLSSAVRAWPPPVPTPPTLSMSMQAAQAAQAASMRGGFPGMGMTPIMGGLGMHPATAAFVAMHGNSWNLNPGGPHMMPPGMYPPHMHPFMPPPPLVPTSTGMPDGMHAGVPNLTPPWIAMSAPAMPDLSMMHAYAAHAQAAAVAAAHAAAASAAQTMPAPPMQLRPAPAPAPVPTFIPRVRTDAPPHYSKPASYASSNQPLVFFWNIGNMHWNLVRVFTGSSKHIEVFEPMGACGARRLQRALVARDVLRAGRPTSRSQGGYASAGLSLRSVPRTLITWLDAVCPLPTHGGWRARTRSAITSRQQGNGFDCGVACLLYAEKCAQGREKVRGDVSAWEYGLRAISRICAGGYM